jgi:hypothetical protein
MLLPDSRLIEHLAALAMNERENRLSLLKASDAARSRISNDDMPLLDIPSPYEMQVSRAALEEAKQIFHDPNWSQRQGKIVIDGLPPEDSDGFTLKPKTKPTEEVMAALNQIAASALRLDAPNILITSSDNGSSIFTERRVLTTTKSQLAGNVGLGSESK